MNAMKFVKVSMVAIAACCLLQGCGGLEKEDIDIGTTEVVVESLKNNAELKALDASATVDECYMVKASGKYMGNVAVTFRSRQAKKSFQTSNVVVQVSFKGDQAKLESIKLDDEIFAQLKKMNEDAKKNAGKTTAKKPVAKKK